MVECIQGNLSNMLLMHTPAKKFSAMQAQQPLSEHCFEWQKKFQTQVPLLPNQEWRLRMELSEILHNCLHSQLCGAGCDHCRAHVIPCPMCASWQTPVRGPAVLAGSEILRVTPVSMAKTLWTLHLIFFWIGTVGTQ
eukprot:EG_transcript_17326